MKEADEGPEDATNEERPISGVSFISGMPMCIALFNIERKLSEIKGR
jgi:hypothetical protein